MGTILRKLPLEMLYRATVLLGLVGSMYLQTHYVPRQEFKEDQGRLWKKLEEIGGSLAAVSLDVKLLQKDNTQLADHETRIRTIERKEH